MQSTFYFFLQTLYVKLPISFPATNVTPITSVNIFQSYENGNHIFIYREELQYFYTIGIKMIGIFFYIKYANIALNA